MTLLTRSFSKVMTSSSHLQSSDRLKGFFFVAFISRACLVIALTKPTCDNRRVTVLFCLVPKTPPWCTGAESNLGDRVLGEIERKSFTALPGKGGHSRLVP